MFIGDYTLSGREGGYLSMPQYEAYINNINDMVDLLGDPRVRWIDGHGISKEMRMYAQDGEEYLARSQHFHSYCRNTGINMEAITVCSNVTDMIGQLLLGHAIGRKADFMERVTLCHACPKCLLPFAIVPYPEMTCVRGPLLPKASTNSCQKQDTQKCPPPCLEQEVMSKIGSESDIISVRQCPLN
ncbi:hypothetical protein ACHAW5_008133 [Stephanodiscus triporus]|uniref:Uncharacterized protein n=1 Tax=Stephanodiscus triporus TaxID=2934178 RepID=A0ABD3NI98_9STRA